MKIATKTLTTLLIVTVMTLGSTGIASAGSDAATNKHKKNGGQYISQLEKITKRHDRKLEVHASVLNVSPHDLKNELKTASFDQVLKKHGFKTREAFQVAVSGKLKDELKKRGWGDEKIQKVIEKRLSRLDDKVN